MTNTQIVRNADALAGTTRAPSEINARLKQAREEFHLVSPASSVGTLPEGLGVSLSIVTVDTSRNEKGYLNSSDLYDVGMGKFGLSKTVLQKLAAALGVSWDPVASGRMDDGRDPYYCRWRSVGSYRAFDGQVVTIVAEKEMDLRPGSPQVQALEDRARSKNKSAEAQIREMRLHIQAHAESKAQLRAIRSTGIKTAYTMEELQVPFVVARVMFTGQTSDPELKREFARMTGQAFLSAGASLYGRGASVAPQPQAVQPLRIAAPPVGSVGIDEDDFPADYGAPVQALEPAPAAPAPAPAPRAQPRANSATGFTIPGGRDKGKPLAEAELSSLEWWARTIAGNIEGGTSRYPEKDQALLDALHAEIARREGGVGQGTSGGDY